MCEPTTEPEVRYLLPGVVGQVGAGSEHWAVVLDGQTLQLGPESLLLLRHHTVGSTLRREEEEESFRVILTGSITNITN